MTEYLNPLDINIKLQELDQMTEDLDSVSGSIDGISVVYDEDDMVSDDDQGLSTQQSIKAYVDNRLPTGAISMYGASAAPIGWILCDGSAVNRTTYSILFAVIGTTFGVGDGSTTFNVPDFRDNFPVGTGTTYSLNDKGGENTHTLTEAELPAHTHGAVGNHTHTYYNTLNSSITDLRNETVASAGRYSQHNRVSHNTGNDGGHTHTSVGSDTAHENRPPYIGINFIIKT